MNKNIAILVDCAIASHSRARVGILPLLCLWHLHVLQFFPVIQRLAVKLSAVSSSQCVILCECLSCNGLTSHLENLSLLRYDTVLYWPIAQVWKHVYQNLFRRLPHHALHNLRGHSTGSAITWWPWNWELRDLLKGSWTVTVLLRMGSN